jgi:hypothetical protein
MAKRAPKGEASKGETITVRLSPQMKWALEILARIERRTLSGVVEDALIRHVKLSTEEVAEKTHNPKYRYALSAPFAEFQPNEEFSRVLALYFVDEFLLSYSEKRTVKLLENLELLRRNPAKDWEVMKGVTARWYDFHPLLIDLIWNDVKTAAKDEPPDMSSLEVVLSKAKAFVVEATQLAEAVARLAPDMQTPASAKGSNDGA